MKRKVLLIGAIVIILLVGCIEPACMYYEYRQERERLSQEPYFTEYELTLYEYRVMARKYYVEQTKDYREDFDIECWPDYSHYTMEATKDTEMAVAVLNYWLFDAFDEKDAKGLEKALEYGFSSENRITVDWVLSHPREAVEIMHFMRYCGDWFNDYQRIEGVYNEITGGLVSI